MTPSLEKTPTSVPIAGDQSVSIDPGQPWPSAYRGSQYSIVSDIQFDDAVLKWEQRDLAIFTDPPEGLRKALVLLGKSGGYGSVRITADDEVLTKIPADDYKHVDQAPIDSGWIPVYVGKLSDPIEFDEVSTDPAVPSRSGIKVWKGFPFNHGERWAVGHDDTLVWKWRDYRFESAFDHSDLVAAYDEYRAQTGRLYFTENGHVWINVPKDGIAAGKEGEIAQAVQSWKQTAQREGDDATLRLVNRRLVATSRDDDPATGHFPIHLGHLRDFDDGVVPKPVVTDESYYQAVCEYESVWE
jgi:hypothetical protein